MSIGKTSKEKSRNEKCRKWKMSKGKKCRINRKSCLMLIMKYLFDFNEKKEKYVYYKWQILRVRVRVWGFEGEGVS